MAFNRTLSNTTYAPFDVLYIPLPSNATEITFFTMIRVCPHKIYTPK